MRRRYRSNNSSPAYEVSFASVNSSGRFLLTRACNSVFLRLTVDGLSFVVGGLGGTSLSTTTKGLFQFAARSSARKNCRIRVRKPLNELRNELDPSVFWQVHRSTIVNANAIAGVSRDMFGHINLKLKRREEKLNV